MANDVKVIINLKKPTGKTGFGMPLILASKAETAVAYTECKNIEAVIKAGFAEETAVYNAAQLIFNQNDAPAQIAVYASTDNAVTALEAVKNKAWRQLIAIQGTEDSTVKEIATFIEKTTDKMYFARVSDLAEITGEGNEIAELDRTVLFYYSNDDVATPEAALVGATAGKKAGSFTYKNMILKGIKPMELTDAEITAAHEANCITFVTKAGDNVTTEGKVVSGEYIDVIDSKDYVLQEMEYNLQKVLNTADKIGYDNNGIAILENACVNVLNAAYNNGIIATKSDGSGDYEVNFEPRENTTEEERIARKYVRGIFRFALMGAIHEVEVYGTIEV